MQSVPVIFQVNGSLPASGYLPGLAQCPESVVLTQALAVVSQPFTGTLTLLLEVAGALTGDMIELVGTGGTQLAASAVLKETVLAGDVVRWRCDYTGDITQAPQQVQVTLVWEPFMVAAMPELQLGWVAEPGAAAVPLFEYEPATETFVDVSDGYAAGRVRIDTSHGWSLFIEGSEVIRIRDGVLSAVGILEGEWPDPDQVWVQFTVNSVPWMTVTTSGIWVGSLTDTGGAPLPGDAVQFTWPGVAALTVGGLFALSVKEGVPQ